MKTLLTGAAALSIVLAACSTADDTSSTASADADKSSSMAKDDQMSTMVGGADMLSTRNIVENASNSADHTTLVAAVKAAGLVQTLSGAGPFTVFAPTNAAFDALPAGTVDSLLLPASKEMLTKILTAHVVAGEMNAADLAEKATAMGGKAELQTVSGDTLTFWSEGGKAYIGDESGGRSVVTIADVGQSNGVIHVVDAVLLPK